MSRDFELESCEGLARQDLAGRCHPSPPWASAALSLHARLAKARFELGDKNKTERMGVCGCLAISGAGGGAGAEYPGLRGQAGRGRLGRWVAVGAAPSESGPPTVPLRRHYDVCMCARLWRVVRQARAPTSTAECSRQGLRAEAAFMELAG